jgi:lysophospholipase L1-like esterase
VTDFYFDPTASGSTGAGTLANPFRNQAQLAAGFPYSGGHRLLFKRGTRWRPGLSGTDGNTTNYLIPARVFAYSNNVVDAYGTGAKPIIDGSIDLTSWTAVAGQTDVYQASMSAEGNNNYYLAPGHLARNGVIPYLTRWQGSVSATVASWIETFACSFDRSNTWYLRSTTAPGTVKASYWRMCFENSISSKVYGCAIRNIRFEHFSGYPMIFTGLDGGVIDACEGRGIGGDYRSAFDYHEGNFFDIRAGSDNMVVENCLIEDVFDSGVSPQFGNGWNAWNSLSNVTIRKNVFKRCGLGGLEIVPQSPNGCSITGLYIDDNTFEECGKGPFRNASTSGGGGSAIGMGLGNWVSGGGLSSTVDNVYVRRNRFIDCRVSQGYTPYPLKLYFIGNVATFAASKVSAADAALYYIRPFDHDTNAPMQMHLYGNVFAGFPDVVDHVPMSNVETIDYYIRRNTIVDCTRAFNARSRANVNIRSQNNTLLRVGTAAANIAGGATFTTEGGHYLSSVTTLGFTAAANDATAQPAPSFFAGGYVPAIGSPLYSGGVQANTGYTDPNGVAFVGYPAGRNAYAKPTEVAFGAIECVGDSLTYGGDAANPFHSYRGALQDLLTAGGYTFDFIGPRSGGGLGSGLDSESAAWGGACIDSVGDAGNNLAGRIASEIFPAQFNPKFVILFAGWNDLGKGSAAVSTVATRYETSLLTAMRDARPNAKFCLVTLTPSQNSTESIDNNNVPGYSALNAKIRALAGASSTDEIIVADAAANAGLASGDWHDYLHLTPSGAAKLARVIYDAMIAAGWPNAVVNDGNPVTPPVVVPILAPGASRRPQFRTNKVQPGNTLLTWQPSEGTAAVKPSWSTSTLPVGFIGTAYVGAAVAAGATSYSKISGPSWLTIDGPSGALGGTPTGAAASYEVVLRATNAAGSVDVTLILTVRIAIVVTTTSIPAVVAGTTGLAPLEATGTGPFTWTVTSGASALAALGMEVVGSAVSWTNAVAGTASITVRATDPAGTFDDQALSVSVVASSATLPGISTETLPAGTLSTAYTAPLAATGKAPFAFTVIAGALAAGLTLSHVTDYDVDVSGATVRDAMADPLRLGYYPHNLMVNSRDAAVYDPLANWTDNGLVSVPLPPDALPTSRVRSATVSNGSLLRMLSEVSSVVGEQYAGGAWLRTASGTVTIAFDCCDNHVTNVTLTTTWQFVSEAALNNSYTYNGFCDIQPTSAGTIYICEPRVHRGLKGLAYHETTGTLLDASPSWLLDPATEYKPHNLARGSERLVAGENGWVKGPNLTANGESGALGGYPAWSFTSVTPGNSYLAQQTTTLMFPGETVTVSFYCDTNVGTGRVDAGGSQFYVIDKTLVSAGVYLWRFRITLPAGAYTMTAYMGVVDAAAGVTWRATRLLINRGLVVGTYVATTTAPTSYHIANAARGVRLRCSAAASTGWQMKADGSFEPRAHNLCPGSANITTQNGWSIGPNLTQNGCAGPLNGLPAYSFTSTNAGNSYILRNITVEPGRTYALRWYMNTSAGSTFMRFRPSGRQINVNRVETATGSGVWECTLTATAALTNETSIQFFAGAIDAPNGTTWATTMPQVCNDAITPYVPTGSAAVFGPAVRWAANDGGAYEVQGEEARTNNIRNSAAKGAVASGAFPDDWSMTQGVAGLTGTIVGPSTLLGMPAVDIRIQGTHASNSYAAISFRGGGITGAASAQVRTLAVYYQRTNGSNNGIANFAPYYNELTSGGVYVTGGRGTTANPTTTVQRAGYTRTLSGGGTVAMVDPYVLWDTLAGQAIDITLRIACPQEELGASASTPMLGFGSITTRAEDIPIVEGLPSTATGTMLTEFTPGAAGAVIQSVVVLDDGTANHRIVMGRAATTGEARFAMVTGGAATFTAFISTLSPTSGALARYVATWDALGVAHSLNGAAVQTATPTLALPTTNRIVLGNQSAGARALNGGLRLARLRAWKSPASHVVVLGNNGTPLHGDRAVISGTPSNAGTFYPTILMLDASGAAGAQKQFSLRITDPNADVPPRRTWVGPDGGGVAWRKRA